MKEINTEIPTDEDAFNNFKNYDTKNNFSVWYPKFLSKLNVLKMKNAYVEQISLETFKNLLLMLDDCTNINNQIKIIDFARQFYINAKNHGIKNIVTFKNGKFSDKFDFSECSGEMTVFNVAKAFCRINWDDLSLDVGGCTEFVVRDFIFYDHEKTPTIYKGLPLRTEFRVFYDFSNRKIIKTINYWDYDYVFDNLFRKTDKIIFENEYPIIEKKFNEYKNEVESIIIKDFTDIDLTGIYSVDILLDDSGFAKNDRDYYLIDIATAETSAYWK